MPNPQQEAFNFQDIKKHKANGSLQLQKIGKNAIFMVKDRYNPDTGDPADPVFIRVSPASLKELHEKNLLSISAIQTDNEVILELIQEVEALLTDSTKEG